MRQVTIALWLCGLCCGCGDDDGAPVIVERGADAARPGPAPAADAGPPAELADPPMPDSHIYDGAILSFVATRFYHDFPSLSEKHGSKFEVFLLPTLRPEHVERLRVFGPDGFVFDFANEPFASNGNGYIANQRLPVLWYQGIRMAPLEDGEYTVQATFENGERQSYSRELASGEAVLDFYLAHRDEMRYVPSSGGSPANDTVLSWSTLRELGGPDAYYNAWISSGTQIAIDADSARGDAIFWSALLDPNAGLNVGSSRQGSAQDPLPLGPQTWHPEITDSNRLDAINIVIFPPAQHFIAE